MDHAARPMDHAAAGRRLAAAAAGQMAANSFREVDSVGAGGVAALVLGPRSSVMTGDTLVGARDPPVVLTGITVSLQLAGCRRVCCRCYRCCTCRCGPANGLTLRFYLLAAAALS
jgi:hypothetical protein